MVFREEQKAVNEKARLKCQALDFLFGGIKALEVFAGFACSLAVNVADDGRTVFKYSPPVVYVIGQLQSVHCPVIDFTNCNVEGGGGFF